MKTVCTNSILYSSPKCCPSTEAFDRGGKFSAYRQLESLQTYWLIDSQSRSVDCFNRTNDNDWLMRSFTNEHARLSIPSLNLEWQLGQLYEDML